MNFGFNSNVRVGQTLYHVQTEDRGPAHPFLDTVVYVAGRVVHKRTISYQDLAGAMPDGKGLEQRLHERLADQHREVIAGLEAGTLGLNALAGAPVQAPVQAQVHQSPGACPESLQIHLLNSRSWLAQGNVTLEIELQKGVSTAETAGADVEAFFESEKNRSTPLRTRANADGRATLNFPLPPVMADGTSLVIRATDGDLYGELRFRLKAGRSDTAPAPSSK